MRKKFIETKWFIVLLHILIWSTFFSLQILSFQNSVAHKPAMPNDPGPDFFYYRFFFQSTIILMLYYANSLIYIPKLLFQNKFVKFILVLIFTLIAIFILDDIFSRYTEPANFYKRGRPQILMFISVFIIAISTTIKLAQKWIENESKQKEMIHERMNSELSALKSQVNPHFLFNTLNGIYSLANTKSDKTAPAIVKLSQLMRYMLDESKQQFVPLNSEIEYINTFIELQKLRLFDNVKIEYTITGNPEGIKIQPLMLIPFIENAFKHGIDSRTNCEIKIDLLIGKEYIELVVINDLLNARKSEEKSGFGLKNIRRRLELEYPEKHSLKTEIRSNKFIAKLNLSLQ